MSDKETEGLGDRVMKKTRPKGRKSRFRSLLIVFFVSDLVIIGALLVVFHQYYKTLETVVTGMWAVIAGFFAYIKLRKGRGVTLPTLFGYLHVQIITVMYTIIILLFAASAFLEIHTVTITTYRDDDLTGGVGIYWDKQFKGKTDSLTGRLSLAGQKIGTYALEYRLQGYRPSSCSVSVPILGAVSPSHNFTRDEQLVGRLFLNSVPEKAEIWIGDSATLRETPATILDLPAGEYYIVLMKAGYKPETIVVDVIADSTAVQENIRLQKRPTPRGTAAITSDPSQARICLDGRWKTEKTPAAIQGLEAGQHTLELRIPVSDREVLQWKNEITVIANQTTQIHRKLERKQLFFLEVRSSPGGAEIYVDNYKSSEGTTSKTIKLTSGTHNLTLKKQGYHDKYITVDISKDQVTETYELVKK